jgi:hypothetical protein
VKFFIEMGGFYEGIQARREKVFGRLELLRVLHDRPPYWFIRLQGHRAHDDKYWDGNDTGLCWRFAHREPALGKFEELCSHPEYQQEALEALKRRGRMREIALERMASGKLKDFRKAEEGQKLRCP